MKSFIRYKSGLLIVVLLFSCSDDFLNLVPISSRSTDGFYNSEEQIEQAVAGLYDGLQATQTPVFAMLMKEQRSDNSFQVSLRYNYHSIIHFNESSDNTQLYPAWSSLYESIYRCNIFLSRIGGVEFTTDTDREVFTGEAKFLRALFYFDLVRYFGGVPIVTKPLTIEESLEVGRSSVAEVYELIIADLQDAIRTLPESYPASEVGRATVYAAKALLGRVYVTTSGYPLNANNWSAAKDLFADVIASGQFEFYSDYSAIFDVASDNGKHSVFAVQYNANAVGEGNPVPRLQAPNNIDRNHPTLGIASGGNDLNPYVSQDLIDSYEPGDERKDHTIQFAWMQNDGKLMDSPFSRKFVSGTPGAQNTWDINWPVIRYTDVLMMYAEALNELGYVADGEAFSILNQVRNRAGLAPKTSAEVPDQQAFRDWMMNERRHEFAFEYQRWFDLVRTDRALTVMQDFLRPYGLDMNVTRDRYIYPLPDRVLQTNPLMGQNPGY